jgi:sugar lactone lactonase YvrE
MSASKNRVLADGFTFAEGPRWYDGALWVADQHAHQVSRVELDGKKTVVAKFNDMPSGLGFLPDGSLLVATMRDRMILRVQDGKTSVHADLTDVAMGFFNPEVHTGWINDMVTDGQGRTYVGHRRGRYGLSPDLRGWVILVQPDGSHYVVAEDVIGPNGSAITPDGRTLVVAESQGKKLSAWTIEEDGSLFDRRVFAELDKEPDGICLDAEGAVWVAQPSEGAFIRVREGGEVVDSVEVEVEKGHPIACALGGEDRKTLYMIVTDMHGTVVSDQRTAADDVNSKSESHVEMVEVSVPGAGWP